MADEGAAKRSIGSLVAGIIFGSAWWLFVDGYVACPTNGTDCDAVSTSKGYAWLPPFFASVAYLCLVGMKWTELREDIHGDSGTATKARVFLLAVMLIAILSIGGAAFIMAEKFLRVTGQYNWAGVSCLVSTVMIVFASFVHRFTNLPPAEGY